MDVPTDGKRQRYTIVLPAEVVVKLEAYCWALQYRPEDIMIKVMSDWVKKHC